MATITETNLKWVQKLKDRGEPVLQPKYSEPFGITRGYIKTQNPPKDAGAIFQDETGTFGLHGDRGALYITGIKWEDLGLCDSQCWYEWMSPETYNPKKETEVEKRCPCCGQVVWVKI